MAGQYLVVGLGRFGRTVAVKLAHLGQSVLAVDADRGRVQEVAAEVDAAVTADTTDEEVLRELRPERMACAVVAIGMQSLEASILTTALLRQIGVPRILARGVNELHARVLRAVGADEVVNPEAEIGDRLARRLAQPNVFEQLELGDEVDLAEVAAPEAFVGSSLVDLDIRKRFGVSVVAIRRAGSVHANPEGGLLLESGDVLVVIGKRPAIRRVAAMA
jgi:trk system potassium uptake protein TrkA